MTPLNAQTFINGGCISKQVSIILLLLALLTSIFFAQLARIILARREPGLGQTEGCSHNYLYFEGRARCELRCPKIQKIFSLDTFLQTPCLAIEQSASVRCFSTTFTLKYMFFLNYFSQILENTCRSDIGVIVTQLKQNVKTHRD